MTWAIVLLVLALVLLVAEAHLPGAILVEGGDHQGDTRPALSLALRFRRFDLS